MKSVSSPRSAEGTFPDVPVAQTLRVRGGVWRKAVETVLLALIGVIIFRTWCVEGLFQPLVVPGGSMAETLLGTHRTVECGECGFRFHCGSDLEPVARRAVCPNCGCVENDLEGIADLRGERILLNKSAFMFRRPRPWEVVAFRDPGRGERIVVKRVVGLPGETITLKNGDVYADGKIRRKPLWLQRAMAVAVHDATSLKTRLQKNCWITDGPEAAWRYCDGGFIHPAGPPDGRTDWLAFCPGRLAPENENPQRTEKWIPTPITDVCGYNQTRPRRVEDIHVVDDLMLSLRISKIIGRGKMYIHIRDGQSEFLIGIAFNEADIDDGGSRRCRAVIEARRDGCALRGLKQKTVQLPADFADRGVLLEVSLFDRCLLLAVDSREVINYPYDPLPDAATGESAKTTVARRRPLAVGSDGLGLVLRDVRVYRDVYYAYPSQMVEDASIRAGATLGADEYYVLGDNSAISVDSRHWGGNGAVSHRLLWGKPFAAFLSGRNVNVAGRRFQVPDIGRIRFIR